MRNLIRKAPPWIKQPTKYIYGLIPYEKRLGKVFWNTYNFLQESQWWSKKKLEEYQMGELEKLLNHAYENVPYYRRVFNERGLKPKDIKDFDDLKKLPYLTKEIIRDNLEDLITQNYPKSRLKYVTTGGSTGIPMGFYQEKNKASAIERAFMLIQWNRVGFGIGEKCVVLRGNVVHLASKGKFWEYDSANKDLILSSYHMTDKTLPNYIEKIKEFRPNFIRAYPSAITIFARFMKENNIREFPSIKAILCGSENLYPWQRQLIEKAFNSRVYSWYGHTEKCCLSGECEKSSDYHIFPEYGYTEFIDKKGDKVIEEDKLGEIVATGFNNYVFPFIRYRTQDFAVPSKKECSCGRKYNLIKRVEGRLQEFIVANDGSLLTLGPAIFSIHDINWTKIKQLQFLQEIPGELIIKIVKSTNSDLTNEETEEYILRLFRERLKGRCKLYVRFVSHIPRTKSGKYRYLIQKLPIKFRE